MEKETLMNTNMEELKKRKLEEFDDNFVNVRYMIISEEDDDGEYCDGGDYIKSFLSSAIEEAWKGGEEHAARNAVEYMDEVDYENYYQF